MFIKNKELVSILRTSTYQNPNGLDAPGSYGRRIQISESPSITAVLTKYGKCMVYGGNTLEDWGEIVKFVAEQTKFHLSHSYLVRNMVYRAELSAKIDLTNSLGQYELAEYEPEQFPGLIIRSPLYEKLTLIAFKNGKMMITGVRGETQSIEEQMIEVDDLVRELSPL